MEATIKETPGTFRGSEGQRPDGRAGDIRLVKTVHDDLLRMGMPRVNLLLAGTDGVLKGLLEELGTHFQQPVSSWSPGQPFLLPPVERTGTMLLHDVGALTLDDQIHLLEWLAGAIGRTQVVSTTTTPLLPRVRAGAFIDTLYYRLNTVYVDATA